MKHRVFDIHVEKKDIHTKLFPKPLTFMKMLVNQTHVVVLRVLVHDTDQLKKYTFRLSKP